MFTSMVYAANEIAETVAPIVAAASVGDAWNQLLTAVIAAAIPVVGIIGTYAVVLVRSWLKAKIEKIKNDELRAAADFAMKRVDYIVTNVVKEIQQTRPTGGKLTPEEGTALLKRAYGLVKGQITKEVMDIVSTVVEKPDRYLVTKIEAAVGEVKLAKITAECK
jgi:hypothetical protein